MSGVELALGAILAPIVDIAFNTTSRSAISRVKMRRSGLTKSERQMIELFDAAELEHIFNKLSIHADVPQGISARDVEKALKTPELVGSIKEVIVAAVAESPPSLLARLEVSFVQNLIQRLPGDRDFAVEELSRQVFDHMLSACKSIARRLEAADRDAYVELRQSGQLFTLLSSIDRVEAHLEAHIKVIESPDIAESYVHWEASYRPLASSAHGYLEPPDFDQKRKVPFEDLYVTPSFSLGGDDTNRQLIGLESLVSQLNRTVVLGDPGGGKSTVSRFIAYMTAQLPLGELVPFVITLRNLPTDTEPQRSIVNHIEDRVNGYYQCPAPAGCIDFVLASGRGLVILDGLDELLDVSMRRDVTERVELFARRYPLSRILVTSRSVGYKQAQLDPQVFRQFHLSGFSDENVEVYAKKWFALADSLEPDEATDLANSFVSESEVVPDLRTNPLMLALMCIIYRGEGFIPKNRPAVYERCATLLFEKWDSSRQIHVELRAADYVDAAMKHLAFWMLTSTHDEDAVSEAELVDECTTMFLANFAGEQEAHKAAVEFIEFCRGRAWVFTDAGSTADGEALFKFTHRTFMEYFAAFHLTKLSDTAEELGRRLLPKISNQEWDVVAQLAVQIFDKSRLNGAQRVFNYCLNNRTRRSLSRQDNILSFVIRCMSFIPVTQDFSTMIASRVFELVLNRTRALQNRDDRNSRENMPFASLIALLKVRRDAVGPIQQTLSLEVHAHIAGDESSLLTARFFSVELLAFGRFLDHTARTTYDNLWIAWSRELFQQYREVILSDTQEGLAYWHAAREAGFISTRELFAQLRMQNPEGLTLDPVFHTAASPIFRLMRYGPAIDDIFIETYATPSDGSTWEDNHPNSEAAADLLEQFPAPPYTSVPARAIYPYVHPASETFILEQHEGKQKWLMIVLTLISWEVLTRTGIPDASLKERFPEPIQPLLWARSSPDASDAAMQFIGACQLSEEVERLMMQWAADEVDFTRVPRRRRRRPQRR